jgi:hypothetical protein
MLKRCLALQCNKQTTTKIQQNQNIFSEQFYYFQNPNCRLPRRIFSARSAVYISKLKNFLSKVSWVLFKTRKSLVSANQNENNNNQKDFFEK